MPRLRLLSSLMLLFLAGFSQSTASRPSLPDAQAWFSAARVWLDAQGARARKPAESQGLSKPSDASSAMPFSAVAVVLRLDGRIVGNGWARGPGTPAVTEALENALAEARADRRIATLPPELGTELGRRLTLELEFSGAPVALVGDRLDLMATRVEPALEAFAIRNGDRWVFALPCSIQAYNQSSVMNYLALTLANEVGLDPAASKDLKIPDGAAAYRCATRRLAQRSPEAAPFDSVRGRTVVQPSEIDGPRVRAMASELAGHLAQRWPALEGLPDETARTLRALGPRATYQPSRNNWPDAVSPPSDQALAAIALAEFAAAPWAPDAERAQARTLAIDTLTSLRQVADGETPPATDASAAAGALLAAATLDRTERSWADESMRAWLRELADSLRSGPASRTTPSPGAASMAWAVLDADLPEAWRAVAWNAAEPDRVATASPWLLAASANAPPDAAAAWRAALAPLLESQFLARVDGASADDLDGGWATGVGTPWPTAHSARAALALATALQRPDVVAPESRPDALRSLRSAMRFLAQLQADEDACHAFRDPARARGGIRAACWDSDQPMAASAYALLTTVRAADCLDGTSQSTP